LEEKKLKSQLILKAIDTGDQNDAANFLRFLNKLKLVAIDEKAISEFIKEKTLPLRPQSKTIRYWHNLITEEDWGNALGEILDDAKAALQ
jgi:hypothetical protein